MSHRSLLALAAALCVLPGCLIIDLGDDDLLFNEDAFFGDDDFDDFDGVISAQVQGDIGPARGIDSEGSVDGWVGDSAVGAEVEGRDQSGSAILSIVDVYGLELVVGARSSEVSVTGCSGAGFEDEYEYDRYTDDAEAEVVDCGCDDEGVVDVVISSNFSDEGDGYGAQTHVTTLRIRQ